MSENVRADLTNKYMKFSALQKKAGEAVPNFSEFASEYARRKGITREELDAQIEASSTTMDVLKTAGLSALDTATFGIGDDIADYLISPEIGEMMRRRTAIGGDLDPKSSIAGGIAGAFVPGMGALGAARLGARGAMAAVGNTSRYGTGTAKAVGAGMLGGGTYGVGSMEPEDRDFNTSQGLQNVGIEAAKSAGLGGIGGAAGASVGRAVTRGIEKYAPKLSGRQAKELSEEAYDDALSNVNVTAQETVDFSDDVIKRLGEYGSQTAKASDSRVRREWRDKFKKIIKTNKKTGEGTNLSELNTLISTFGKDIGKEKNAAMFAQLVKDKAELVDEFAGLLSSKGKNPELLEQAKRQWTQGLKLEAVESAMREAVIKGGGNFTQSGLSNAMTKEAQRLLKLKNISWTPQETALLEQMASDKMRGSVIKLLARFSPKGGLSTMFGVGGMMYDPMTAVALMGGGYVADNVGERAVMQGVDRLRNMISKQQTNTVPFLSTAFGSLGAAQGEHTGEPLEITVPIGDRIPQ